MSHNTFTRKFYDMRLFFFSLYRTKAAAHEMKSFKGKKNSSNLICNKYKLFEKSESSKVFKLSGFGRNS